VQKLDVAELVITRRMVQLLLCYQPGLQHIGVLTGHVSAIFSGNSKQASREKHHNLLELKQHNHHSQQQQLYPHSSAQQPERSLHHCAAMTEVGLAQAAAASLPSLAVGSVAASRA
jgi:hypothetical protein